ncbi:MAG: fibronectin type III domain-containing protein [bacterium]
MFKLKKCHLQILLIALICCGGFLGIIKNEAKASNYVYHCTDTDGEDFYTKGAVNGHDPAMQTDEVYAYADQCNGENEIREFYCDHGSSVCSELGCIARTSYQCPNGCQDGACILNLEPKAGQKIGDADGDGNITKIDADLVSKMDVGLISKPSDICAIDVDQNNKVDTFDALAISEIVSGSATSPGNCGNPVITFGPDTSFTKGNTYTIAFKITNANLNSKLIYRLNGPSGNSVENATFGRTNTSSSKFYIDRNNVLTFLMSFNPKSSWTAGDYKIIFDVETNGVKLEADELELEVLNPLCKTTTSSSALCRFEIPLKKNWNFISLPINPENSSAEAVLESIKGKYSQVKTQTQSMIAKSDGSAIGDLKQIYSKQGIEIKMNEDAKLTVNGYPSAFLKLVLKEGWNWVGSGSLGKVKIKDFVDKEITSGYTFNNGISDTDLQIENPSVFKQYPNDFTEFEPGKGYKLNTSSTKPDLIITDLKIDRMASWDPETLKYIWVSFKNLGGGIDGRKTIKTKVTDSENNEIYYMSVETNLTGNDANTLSVSTPVKNLYSTHKLKAEIDIDNVINESNENNNTFVKTITVDRENPCADTDGGRDYYTRGTSNTFTDYCIDNTNLREFYCENGEHKTESVRCESGCKDGACIKDKAIDITITKVDNITSNSAKVYWQSAGMGSNGEYKLAKIPSGLKNAISWSNNVINDPSMTGDMFGSIVELTNLEPNTKYYIELKKFYLDNFGNYIYSNPIVVSFSTFSPTDVASTELTFSNLQVPISSIRPTEATVTWITNFPSNSNVHYWSADKSHENWNWDKIDDYTQTRHSIKLKDLKSFTKYYFTVSSTKEGGNNSTSEEISFTTTVEDTSIEKINNSAKNLNDNKFDQILSEIKVLKDVIKEQQAQIKYLTKLTQGVKELSEKATDAINNFITYGVDENTQKLGAGERAAVMYSYKAAFDKLPETEEELSDAIKIANGRWPSITNQNAENRAKEQFQKVYKRTPDMANGKDNAAVTIMAYGLRQRAENRNMKSEIAGIGIFRNIYNKLPETTEEWNIMQAITYSGAAR